MRAWPRATRTRSATLTFTVSLTPAATLPVTVDWATSDGTAEAGTDYTAANGSLTFETGEESKTVTVTVTGDDADEPNETVTVTLSNAPGATITDATGTGTITDDDDAPTVTLVLTPASIGEDGGESTVTATLDRPSSEETTATVTAAPVSPAVSGDYTLLGAQLTIAPGETTSTGTVTITAVNNEVDALDKGSDGVGRSDEQPGDHEPPGGDADDHGRRHAGAVDRRRQRGRGRRGRERHADLHGDPDPGGDASGDRGLGDRGRDRGGRHGLHGGDRQPRVRRRRGPPGPSR